MILEIAVMLATFLFYNYCTIMKKQATYWQSLGVKCPPPEFPMGNSPDTCNEVFMGRTNANDVTKRQYQLMRGERYYGTYSVSNPCLTLLDPELIKCVLVKDFSHFVDKRGDFNNRFFCGQTRTDKIWRDNMFSLPGEEWKNVRSTFSPIFTSGKMKIMVAFLNQAAKRLMTSFDEEIEKGVDVVELRNKFARFSMDTIASCAFGMDAESFSNPNSDFVRNAKNIFRRSHLDVAKLFMPLVPGGRLMMQALGIRLFKQDETQFFDQVLQNTLKARQRSGYKRNDLIDLMLDALKDNEKDDNDDDNDDDNSKLHHQANKKDLDEMSVIATAILVLVAGYDATAQMLAQVTYELAKNPEIQARLQDEIDDATINCSSGDLPDYATIQSMEYIDMVLHEGLRRHTSVGNIQRACAKDYKLPGTDITIKKGQEIFVNAAGMHSDPRYFPEPETFNPEHFSREAKAARHPYTFFGFGQGPRNCIGMRFALLEAKIALIGLLKRYTVERCERTVDEFTLDPTSVLGVSKEDLYVKIVPRA